MEGAEFDENKSENIEKSDNSYDLSEEKIKKVKSKKICICSSTLLINDKENHQIIYLRNISRNKQKIIMKIMIPLYSQEEY